MTCPKDCSNHGTCDGKTGVCGCNVGYQGSSCSTCSSGYSASGSSCIKDPGTKPCPNNCSNHGKCDTTTGSCTCDTGYKVDDCKACATGYIASGNQCVKTPATVPVIPSLYYKGLPKGDATTCESPGVGWHPGKAGAGKPPFIVWSSNCALPSVADPNNYQGYSARYKLEVSVAGTYRLRAWIPDEQQSCQAAAQYSPEVHYILQGVGQVNRVQKGNAGKSITLFETTSLTAGTHWLHLFDNSSGGCACNTTMTCGVTTKVLADTVYLEYVGP